MVMATRLRADHDRLVQLADAALSERKRVAITVASSCAALRSLCCRLWLKIREMASLLQYGGLIHCLDAFLKGEQQMDKLEAAGKQHLDSGAGRSSEISGQIFEGVERVLLPKHLLQSTA